MDIPSHEFDTETVCDTESLVRVVTELRGNRLYRWFTPSLWTNDSVSATISRTSFSSELLSR